MNTQTLIFNSKISRDLKHTAWVFRKLLMSKLLTIQLDLFIKTLGLYARKMESSIESGINEGTMLRKKKRFYNYLILRARPLYMLINQFYTTNLELGRIEINLDHVLAFIRCVIYIGKGLGYRCFSHYVALNREHAMICACFGHVTNIRKGSPYGSMRSW